MVLTPQPLLQHPSSSNNEADQFYNARPHARTHNKTRKTNKEARAIMKKEPAVRDIRV